MRKARILAALSASALTFLVYLDTLRNGFINWDDNLYVYENVHIRSFDVHFLRWAFLDLRLANWHPLTWVSHALDYRIWGLAAPGHHLTSILIHAVNTFLVVLLIARLLEVGRGGLSPNAVLITSLATGLLFGLHPLHVESVAWVSERKDLLCALFYLLSVRAYLSYASFEVDVRPERTGKYGYLRSLFFFFLALMSKPMAVTLPLVLLVLDWYPLERTLRGGMRRVTLEKVPFFVAAIAASALAFVAQRSGGGLSDMQFVPVPARLVVAASALVSYLAKMIFPLHLSSFYPYPAESSFFSLGSLLAVLGILGFSASCMLLVKADRKLLPAVWTYYVVSLLPVLGIIRVGEQSMADRYTYLPAIGPFLAAGLAVVWFYERHVARRAARKLFFGVALLCVFSSMTYLTVQRIEAWKDSITLWSDVIEKQPTVHFAFNNRGLAYRDAGLYDRAMADYDRALALKPDYFKSYNNRGVILSEAGKLDEALNDFSRAIALSPGFDEAYMNRGVVYDKKGSFDLAVADFDRAVALNPQSYKTYINRGVAFDRRGMLGQALEDYSLALAIDPQSANAYNNRAGIYYKKGFYREAVTDYSRAIALRPDFRQAYYNRALVYRSMGLFDKASDDLRNSGMR